MPVFALLRSSLATVVGMLMGLVPALRVSRVNLLSVLRSETGFQMSRRNWTGSSILVTQIAVSLLLLLSAGLIVRPCSASATSIPASSRITSCSPVSI